MLLSSRTTPGEWLKKEGCHNSGSPMTFKTWPGKLTFVVDVLALPPDWNRVNKSAKTWRGPVPLSSYPHVHNKRSKTKTVLCLSFLWYHKRKYAVCEYLTIQARQEYKWQTFSRTVGNPGRGATHPLILTDQLTLSQPGGKVIETKYSKHWPYTVAHTFDCVCSKINNSWFNPWLSFYFSSLYPAPYIE